MSLVTWNPKDKYANCLLSDNDLTCTFSRSGIARATEGRTSGKWYWEIKVVDRYGLGAGVANLSDSLSGYFGLGRFSYYWSSEIFIERQRFPWGARIANGDMIGVALDLDDGTLGFYLNGVYQGVAFDRLRDYGKMFPMALSGASYQGAIQTANFGVTPFEYEVPNGYFPYDYENADWFNPKKYLFQCGSTILKPTMTGLEPVEGILNAELFSEHGTIYLPDIIGQYDKEVGMIPGNKLGDKTIYGYEFVGYTDLLVFSESKGLIKSDGEKYYSYVDNEFNIIDTPIGEGTFIDNTTDFKDLTTVTDKRTFTMEKGKKEGEGKTFSKKIRPQDWNRKILRMKEL